MNCNVPTDICFSFAGFQARGGLTGEHRDGWGIAFFEGKGVRQFLDHQPSAHSPIAELVRAYPIKSKSVVAHIRKATQGEVRLENTHPFFRELWGYSWIFAHNGNLENYGPQLDGSFEPIGTTDSERAFCFLLQELKKQFGGKRTEPVPSPDFFQAVCSITSSISKFGVFNFLLSNGATLIAHCSTELHFIVRQAPFSTARLKDQDIEVDFTTLTSSADRVAVIATAPLTTNENWTAFAPGTLTMFEDGLITGQLST